MGHVTVTINGRSYKVGCGDGEEARLRQLADILSLRVERLAMDFGQHGNERLLLMAALLTTDELLDARSRLADLSQDLPSHPQTTPASPATPGNLVRLETAHTRSEPITLSAPEASTPSVLPEAGAAAAEPAAQSSSVTAVTLVAAQPSSPEAQSGEQQRSSLEARLAKARTGKPQAPSRHGT